MNKKIIILLVSLILSFNVQASKELMVFVSFSMPEQVLIDLSHDTKKLDSSLLIRGLVKDSFKETILAVNTIAVKSKNGINIHPNWFKELDIQIVPTFAVVDMNVDGSINSFDKVAGNVSLDYALQEISKYGEHKKIAYELLEKLRNIDG